MCRSNCKGQISIYLVKSKLWPLFPNVNVLQEDMHDIWRTWELGCSGILSYSLYKATQADKRLFVKLLYQHTLIAILAKNFFFFGELVGKSYEFV